MIGDDAHTLFREVCESATSFVLTSHINPDGDAIGSQVSLAHFLLDHDKSVRIINQDPTPLNLEFLLDSRFGIESYDSAEHDSVLASADTVVLLDNAAPDRLGAMEPAMLGVARTTFCIDHHPAREMPWGRSIVDDRACATAVMVFNLTRQMGWKPGPAAAEAMYAGLATDTGFFRFNSTDVEAHEVAAELLRCGASPAGTYRAIYERNSLAFTRLLGHALAGIDVSMEGRVATVRIPRELLVRLSAEEIDTSEVNTSLLAIDGIQVALLFRELPGGAVKVSLRSKGVVDVHRLATEFGGGGHRNASGIVMQGTLDDAVAAVISRVRSAVR